MTQEDRKRMDMFQHLVLAGLWVIILCLFKKNPVTQAINYQTNAIAFGDIYGNQGETAADYRRDRTYGGQIGS